MRNTMYSIIAALPASILIEQFEKYIFKDWEFVKFLVVSIIVDTVLGFVKSIINRNVSSKAFGMIAKKLIIYMSVLVISHVLSNYSVEGVKLISFQWFQYFACTSLIIRESISIVENISYIFPGLIPAAIMKRLKDFDSETGNIIKKDDK